MTDRITRKDYLGEVDRAIGYPFQKWLSFAKVIRDRLAVDKKAHMLTEYISRLLELTSKLPMPETSQEGFHAAQELYGICVDIVNGAKEKSGHPFYQEASLYIEEHPLPIEKTAIQAALYYSQLSAEFIRSACKTYCEKVQALCQEIYDDEIIQEHFDRICLALDDKEPMVFLDSYFRKRFLFESISTQFYQGEASFFASLLVMDDPEMRREVFSYLLDDILP